METVRWCFFWGAGRACEGCKEEAREKYTSNLAPGAWCFGGRKRIPVTRDVIREAVVGTDTPVNGTGNR